MMASSWAGSGLRIKRDKLRSRRIIRRVEGWERLNDPAPDFSRTVDTEVVIEGFHFHSRSRSVIRVVEDTPRARSAAQHRFVGFG